MKLNLKHDLEFATSIDQVEVPPQMDIRVTSGVDWCDNVLGGEGFVPSQVTFFTGAPGSGKTTSMLQVCSGLSKSGATVVFNTAEESPYQVSRAAKRIRSKGWKLGTETKMPDLLEKSKRLMDRERASDPNKPFVLVVDSINCMDDGYFDSGRITTATAELTSTTAAFPTTAFPTAAFPTAAFPTALTAAATRVTALVRTTQRWPRAPTTCWS
jgi:predicted ATP-dependent serine protease